MPLAAFLLATAPAAAGPPQRARPDQMLPTLFSDADYPAAAIRAREQGPVGFRLDVGADGKPSACTVVSSSGSSSLDSTTCRLLMERARFQPARDAQGRATTDRFTGRIVWRLEGDIPPRLHWAQLLWTTCLLGEASKLVLSDLADDEIARGSYLGCTALEALVAREVKTPAPLEEARASMNGTIAQWIREARNTLAIAPEAGPRRD